MKRLVIWDVDGTLIDSQHEIVAAMEAAFAGQGLAPAPRADVLGIVGLTLPLAVATLRPDLDAATVDRLVEGYKSAFHANRMAHGVAGSPLFPGIRAVLDGVQAAGVTQAIATGKSRRGLDAIIDGHGLGGLFASTQVSDDHPSKPDPAMVLAALAETGVAADRAVMVGDTSFDMDMGRAAGVRCIGVDWGYHPTGTLLADAIAQAPADLPALIDRLTGA